MRYYCKCYNAALELSQGLIKYLIRIVFIHYGNGYQSTMYSMYAIVYVLPFECVFHGYTIQFMHFFFKNKELHGLYYIGKYHASKLQCMDYKKANCSPCTIVCWHDTIACCVVHVLFFLKVHKLQYKPMKHTRKRQYIYYRIHTIHITLITFP